MTDKKALGLILLEAECIKNRASCTKVCRECPFYKDKALDLFEAIKYISEILKARNPELYFTDNIQHLKEVLENETQSKEVR